MSLAGTLRKKSNDSVDGTCFNDIPLQSSLVALSGVTSTSHSDPELPMNHTVSYERSCPSGNSATTQRNAVPLPQLLLLLLLLSPSYENMIAATTAAGAVAYYIISATCGDLPPAPEKPLTNSCSRSSRRPSSLLSVGSRPFNESHCRHSDTHPPARSVRRPVISAH